MNIDYTRGHYSLFDVQNWVIHEGNALYDVKNGTLQQGNYMVKSKVVMPDWL